MVLSEEEYTDLGKVWEDRYEKCSSLKNDTESAQGCHFAA